jgi:hypothetical protein
MVASFIPDEKAITVVLNPIKTSGCTVQGPLISNTDYLNFVSGGDFTASIDCAVVSAAVQVI